MSRNGKPIPTKFEPAEEAILLELKARTGYSKSEIIRRAVRLLRLEAVKRGSITFLMEELAPATSYQQTSSQSVRLNESPPKKKK